MNGLVVCSISTIVKQLERRDSIFAPNEVSAFSAAMRSRLHDRESNFGKEYLRLFVNRIKLTGQQVEINGSYGALAQGIAQMKTGTLGRVPIFVPDWLPGSGSNRPPSDRPL